MAPKRAAVKNAIVSLITGGMVRGRLPVKAALSRAWPERFADSFLTFCSLFAFPALIYNLVVARHSRFGPLRHLSGLQFVCKGRILGVRVRRLRCRIRNHRSGSKKEAESCRCEFRIIQVRSRGPRCRHGPFTTLLARGPSPALPTFSINDDLYIHRNRLTPTLNPSRLKISLPRPAPSRTRCSAKFKDSRGTHSTNWSLRLSTKTGC